MAAFLSIALPAAAVLAMFGIAPAFAQTYPNKPVRIIIAQAPGSAHAAA
jgi:tripartite-type tricarboxylate transporter receptor subunit TctC